MTAPEVSALATRTDEIASAWNASDRSPAARRAALAALAAASLDDDPRAPLAGWNTTHPEVSR